MPTSSATHHRLAQDFLVFGTIFLALSIVAYLATISWGTKIPRDSTGLIVGRDFLNFWMYGRSATSAEPGLFYDQQAYNRYLLEFLGFDYSGQNWSYPPTVMLLAAPFAQLGYLPALLLWTAAGLAIFVAVAHHQLNDRRLLWALLCSPAAVFCLMSGQSAFVTTATFIAIFAWLDRRPIAAGILIGCLTLKPQLGLLFPVMLIAAGRWRTFASAAVTTAALAALTAAVFGPQVWIDFISKGLPVQNEVLADPQFVATPFYPTVFMNVRGVGASYGVAMAAQLCFTAFAIAAVAWAYRFRRTADPHILFALFVAASICASPYLLAYDTLPLTFAALSLVDAGKLDQAGRRMAQLTYWLPLLQLGFGALHIPGPALIPAAFALYAVLKAGAAQPALRRNPAASRTSP